MMISSVMSCRCCPKSTPACCSLSSMGMRRHLARLSIGRSSALRTAFVSRRSIHVGTPGGCNATDTGIEPGDASCLLQTAMPSELIPGDVNHPEGYFQRRDLADLPAQLLIQLGCWWPSAEGVLELPPEWRLQALHPPGSRSAAGHPAAEFQRQEAPWAHPGPSHLPAASSVETPLRRAADPAAVAAGRARSCRGGGLTLPP